MLTMICTMSKREKKSKTQITINPSKEDEVDHTFSNADEEEDCNENEQIEQVVSAYGIYESFCETGEIRYLYEAIQILTASASASTSPKRIKIDSNSGIDIAKESIEGEISRICFMENEVMAFKAFGEILLSQCYFHLADQGVSKILEDNSKLKAMAGLDWDNIENNFMKAIEVWPYNATARSVYANARRMFGSTKSLSSILKDYEIAAYFAYVVRKEAVSAIKSDEVSSDIKEFIEVLLLDSIGAEYIEDDDVFSFAAVEATSSFMASLLASNTGDHERAKVQLEKFGVTHRVHPKIWEHASGRSLSRKEANEVDIHREHTDTEILFRPTRMKPILPSNVYEKLCDLFDPNASYWRESDYDSRGYHSYWLDLYDDNMEMIKPKNIIEYTIVDYLLPKIKKALSKKLHNKVDQIVGAEWWVHHRPIGANLGHQLHFDTDEALLDQNSEVTHPLVSSVLYLTGGPNEVSSSNEIRLSPTGGSTIVFSQEPTSKTYAKTAYVGSPKDNSYMIFPGNLLHGVLPCPGIPSGFKNNESSDQSHRLTLMVGFWTRNVPENIKKRTLYSACGLLPPPTRKHTWVRDSIQLFEDLSRNQDVSEIILNTKDLESCDSEWLPSFQPAWERISIKENDTVSGSDDPPLEFPFSINHRFFVKEEGEKPNYFWKTLFQK